MRRTNITFLWLLCGAPAMVQADPIPKPCEHRPGSPAEWEGAFCSGNLRLVAPVSVIGIELIHNSLESDHQGGFGYGWRLNLNSTLVVNGDRVLITRGDGTPEVFTRNGGDWLGGVQAESRLVQDAQGFTETFHGGVRFLYRRFSGETYFLQQMVDRNGNTVSIHRDGRDRISSVVDPYQRTTTFQFNGENLRQVQDHEGRVFVLEINGAGELESVTWPEVEAGVPVDRFTYDPGSRHLVVSRMSPGGTLIDFSYYPDGSIKDIIEGGDYLAFRYNSTSIVQESPLGEEITEEYENGALRAVGNRLGEWTTFERDSRHRITRLTDSLGRSWFFAYNATDDLIFVRDPLGQESAADFDQNRNMVALTKRGKTWRWEYDSFNQVTAEIDPLGYTTHFSRDDRGNLTEYADHTDKTRVRVGYDSHGRILALAGSYGPGMTFSYDEFGNLEDIDYPSLGSISRKSSPMGLLLHVINGLGEITVFAYNALGELIGLIYPADPSLISDGPRGDSMLRVTVERDLDNRITYQEANLAGNRISEATGYDPQTGMVNHQATNGKTTQDGLCPCVDPPKPDGGDADGGEDGQDGGLDGGQDGGGQDGGGQDGGGQDGGGQDGGGQDGGGQDGGGGDGGGHDGSIEDDGSGGDGGTPVDGGDDDECVDAGVEEQCQAMGEVQCDQTVSGSTSGGTMSNFTPCSPDIQFYGGEYIYKFTPDSDSMHVSALLENLPEGLDLDVLVLESVCNPQVCKEKGSMEAYFGVKPCMAPYYIVVKGFEPDDTGPFTLKITCYK